MLTKFDDYPVHQTPDPVAYAQSDRNFYDRYFFDGFTTDGDVFFAAALGVYPNLNIMDAAFAVRIGERQYNLQASRHLNMERMDTQVGPIRIEVLEPLQRLRIVVEDNEHGISADLVFEGRLAPIEEPRTVRRNGPRVLSDFTRLTQLGNYSGWLKAGGKEIRLDSRRMVGARDRSWGVRHVGLRDPQPQVPPQDPQFHWVWIPVLFDDRVLLFYQNDDRHGESWSKHMMMCVEGGEVEEFHGVRLDMTFVPGTRWPAKGVIEARDAKGGQYRIEVNAGPRFFQVGLGYLNAEWGHGMNKGPLAVHYAELGPEDVAEFRLPHNYVQCFATVRMTTPDGKTIDGYGAFEVLSMGPHAGFGFTDMIDAG